MLNNYYTLLQIAKKINNYIGYQVIDCFSQDKDNLILVLASDEAVFLQFSLKPNLTALLCRTEFARARKNTVNLFDCLIGEVLQSVKLLNSDRIVEFDFIHTKLVATLFGASKNNLLALDGKSTIIDAYKNKRDLKGTKYVYEVPAMRELHDIPENYNIVKALAFSKYNLGKYYAAQICSELNIEKKNFDG